MSCCKLRTIKKPDIVDQVWPKRMYKGRAGAIIHDSNSNSILLVQSYNNRWGFPKGHREDNETPIQTAQREVEEETGLRLPTELFESAKSRRISHSIYYQIEMNRNDFFEPDIDSLEDDITGIGWFHIDCLKNYERSGRMKLNYDTRKILKS